MLHESDKRAREGGEEDLLGNNSRWRPQRSQLVLAKGTSCGFLYADIFSYLLKKDKYYLNMEGDHMLPVYHQALSKNILHIYYVNA